MINGWMDSVLAGFQALNQILTAGIAITAFSLFLYALSFNLRDRVARSFAIILLCVVVVFTTDALQDKSLSSGWIDLFLHAQWFGIIFLPAAYLHLSDALLVTAGRPSRGRRRIAVRGMYAVSTAFLVLLAAGYLLGPFIADGKPVAHLERTTWTEVFNLFYIISMIWAAVNFWRAFRLMLTRSGRRRMLYLMAGATAPALGSYPFLLYGSSLAERYPFAFWSSVTLINFAVGALVVVMAYSVAFFGVSWPDRVVKSRLMKWLMRGPVTASITLGLMTIVRRGGDLLGNPYSAFVPFTMVASVLSLEHLITLAAPVWESWLFFGRDRNELRLLQNVEERFLTQGDLQQFLEAVLAAVRDHMQSPSAFIAALDAEDLSLIVMAGNRSMLDQDSLTEVLGKVNGDERREFLWGNFWVLPLRQRRRSDMDRDEVPPLLGLLGVAHQTAGRSMEKDQHEAVWLLAERAALALEDRKLQQRIFRSLEDLQPQVEMIQRLRAIGHYDSRVSLLTESLPLEEDLANWVKDALTHYWGGPKLTSSPLMKLQVVQDLVAEADGNAANALRS
ncbi:MAG: hypothetical protein MUO77_02075, partial [Anaerolineales bacterium]|nr:hypothetical protein [Anaerolineales bacterium]